MIGGLVEIAEPDRHLSVYRGFLKISENRHDIGRVPLDDITALILSSHQVTLSKNVLTELAERGAILVSCGRNYHPLSITFPFGNHYKAGAVLRNQIGASEPLKKRLWQSVVRRKIDNQANILSGQLGKEKTVADLAVLSRRVKSGDPENMEAQAARIYWPALMGPDFHRDRHGDGTNMRLNYGYTVLRAATARAVCGAGLHPSLGVYHRSAANAFALVDDLMEPYRPLIDSIVRRIGGERQDNEIVLDPETKRKLASVLQLDMMSERGASPLINCLNRLAQSFGKCLAEKNVRLDFSELPRMHQLV